VLDVGCGVGGPLRNIARFTGAKVIGLNNNEYQVRRANKLNVQHGVQAIAEVSHGDFMKIPFPQKTFDEVYAIEATCHAPDRTGCYSQVFEVLKDGGVFGGYEWTMTDKFDANNADHRRWKHGIEEGNSLPVLTHYSDIVAHLKAAGFEVLEAVDVALEEQQHGHASGWWESFSGGYTLTNFKHTRPGRWVTNKACEVMELLRIAPKGTATTAHVLAATGDALAAAGEAGIFTPMVRKQNEHKGGAATAKMQPPCPCCAARGVASVRNSSWLCSVRGLYCVRSPLSVSSSSWRASPPTASPSASPLRTRSLPSKHRAAPQWCLCRLPAAPFPSFVPTRLFLDRYIKRSARTSCA